MMWLKKAGGGGGGLLIAAISEALTNIDEVEEEGETGEEEEEAGDTEESECKTKQRSLVQPEMDVRVFGAVINEIKVQLNRNRKRPRAEQEMWLAKNGQREMQATDTRGGSSSNNFLIPAATATAAAATTAALVYCLISAQWQVQSKFVA